MIKKIISMLAVASLASFASAAVETGAKAPDFTLTDTSGVEHSLSDFAGKYVVLEWLNHNCPFVVRHYQSALIPEMQKHYAEKGVVWLSINSTNPDHRDYKTPEQADALTAQFNASPAAVLMDAEGVVGKMYDARTTPQMFVISPEGVLIYQGAIDSSPRGNEENPKNFVKMALKAAMADKPVEMATTRPYGCSVKY